MIRYRLLAGGLLMMLIPVLLGMGALGEGPANKIPVPDRKFNAIFIDQMDVVTQCTDASIEGNTYIDGKKGEGTYAIAFDRIQSILFQIREKELRGVVTMTDGVDVELVLNKERKAYGKTAFGTFQIKLTGLKKMTLLNGQGKKR